MSVRAMVVALALGTAALTAPASAATYLITYTGVVTDGSATGAFGLHGDDLTGRSFKAVYKLTFPTPGTDTFVSDQISYIHGGEANSDPSPQSAELTINGVTETFLGNWWGWAYRQDFFPTYGGYDDVENKVVDYVSNGSIFRSSYMYNYVSSNIHNILTTTKLSEPFAYNVLPGDVDNSEFWITTFDFDKLAYQYAVGHFATQRITATSVPEPMTWSMMIGGFGLVGFALRRQHRQVPLSA